VLLMSKRPVRDDLFAIFPDLPWHRPRTAAERDAQAQRHLRQTQMRARGNILRRRAPTALNLGRSFNPSTRLGVR
jgi:hypothetical protein